MIQRPHYMSIIKKECDDLQTVLFLIGARQVGKSTLLLLAQEKNIIDPKTTWQTSGDTLIGKEFTNGEDFLSLIMQTKDVITLRYLIIDEAQYISNIGIILKQLVDMVRIGRFAFKIIVSGSGSLNVFKGMSDTLTGRKVIVPIYPLSFVEFLDAKGVKLLANDLHIGDYQRYFEEYSVFGAYPQIVTTVSIEKKKELFVQLLNDYLFKDVILLLQEKEFTNFRKFLGLIASKIGSLVSVEQLVQEIGLSRYIVEKYLFVIENTFLFSVVHGFVGNKITGEIKKMFKFYINDIGMLRFLLGVHERVGDLKGKVVENFVYMTLLAHKKSYQEVYFRNTKQGGEIDFILYDQFTHQIIPIEVKSGNKDNVSASYLGFLTAYQDKTIQAFCTTESLSKERLINNHSISFVPYLYLQTMIDNLTQE